MKYSHATEMFQLYVEYPRSCQYLKKWSNGQYYHVVKCKYEVCII